MLPNTPPPPLRLQCLLTFDASVCLLAARLSRNLRLFAVRWPAACVDQAAAQEPAVNTAVRLNTLVYSRLFFLKELLQRGWKESGENACHFGRDSLYTCSSTQSVVFLYLLVSIISVLSGGKGRGTCKERVKSQQTYKVNTFKYARGRIQTWVREIRLEDFTFI